MIANLLLLTSKLYPEFLQDGLAALSSWFIVEIPSILLLTGLFVLILRMLHFMINRINKIVLRRAHENGDDQVMETTKRVTTLVGIVRGAGKIVLWTIYLLILLGKFNINIAPILASAGILGLAVGFGAQELVRDFISGFFILLEDQIRTGDFAIINGTNGMVEKIELRTVTLRDASGVVHIFQNGKINTISNMTKEWSAIVIDMGVAYKEDTDAVCKVMKEVGAELRSDESWKDYILEDIEVLGVNDFADSAVIIKIRIKTIPLQQWAVGREYRRRLKYAFDAKKIEIPFPQRTLVFPNNIALKKEE